MRNGRLKWQRMVVVCFLAFWPALASVAASVQLGTGLDPAANPPSGGGGDSWHPIITPDGRYVLFASRANNLVSAGTNSPFLNQTPPKINIFLRDRLAGVTELVSFNWQGTGPANGDSIPTALSTNGQFALFESAASDVVPGDTNNVTDVFLRDLVRGTNLLVSVSTNGGFGNGASWESVMTPDGRFVAFASAATNLVLHDANGIQDIFVRDMQAGMTQLASPGATAASPLSAYAASSDSPQITSDGRYVVFRSSAVKLVYPGPSVINEVYVRDLAAGTTTLASTNAHRLLTGTPYSYNQVISDDGQFVAFESSSATAAGCIQRFNLQSGATDFIHTNAVRTFAYNHFRSVDMTADGRYVAFIASTNTGSGSNTTCVFVWDAQSGTAGLVSTNLSGAVPTNSVCDSPTIDPSGRWIAFLCTATNLTANGVAGDFHIYLHDAQTGVITLVDAGASGSGLAKDILSTPALTPDGRFIAFDCSDSDLVADDNNQAFDVFVRDLTAGTNEMISVCQPGLATQSPGGANLGAVYSVSADGRYLAYSDTGDGLLPVGYTNDYRGVFVRDLLNGTNILASADTNGMGGADSWSFEPSLSGDGRYVAFTSGADNLATGLANHLQEVFVRDLAAGATSLVSVNYSGTAPGDHMSYAPTISSDGRYVLFRSQADNLVPGGKFAVSTPENLFLRDRQNSTNYAVSTAASSSTRISAAAMTPDARFVAWGQTSGPYYFIWDTRAGSLVYTNTTSGVVSNLAISPDGNRVAYAVAGSLYATDRAANSNWLVAASIPASHAGLQFSGDSRCLVYASASPLASNDTNNLADVYLYDFQAQSNFLVSQSYRWAGAANGASDSPAISADVRFVAYRSAASDLVPGATNGLSQMFVFDRQTGITTLVSVSRFGDFSANERCFSPMFSGDSQTLVFPSWASDLTAQDFNQGADLFALKLYGSVAPIPFVGQILFAPATGQPAMLAWPAAVGTNYLVQFKNNMNDPVWQTLNVGITVDGDRAYATDITPSPSQRFYRIVAY
jgi:Tol biopolymer transport system component